MMNSPFGLGDDTPVYVISVAAQLSGMHPQTLRQYDRMGLVQPGRSAGRGRRYSMRDIETLREIQRLSQEEGVNLAGVKQILELRRVVEELRDHVLHLQNELSAARTVVSRRMDRRSYPGPYSGTQGIRRTAVVVWRPPSDNLPGIDHGDRD